MGINLFTYDLAEQTITDNSFRNLQPNDNFKTYKLGQNLLDFINFDFSEYDKNRKKANFIFAQNNYDADSYSEHIDSLVNKHFPKLNSVYYELSHGNTLNALGEYLLDSLPDIPYLKNIFFNNIMQFSDDGDFDFFRFQSIHKVIFTLCLSPDVLPEQSALEKYMNANNMSYGMDGISFREKTIFRYKYSESERLKDEIEKYANTQPFNIDDSNNIFPFLENKCEWRNREIEVIHGYTFETPQEALQCEFLKMLELGIKIRKCAVCGKYFILSGHDGKCCDNLYKNTGLTCQQVFADRNYKSKRKENPILKEYDKAYKRMYARYSSRKNLSSKEYEEWKNEASQERDKALKAYEENSSQIVIDNFKQFLGNK